MFAHAAAGALVVVVATAGLILGCGSASEWSRAGTLGVRVLGLDTTPAPANGGSVSVTTGNVPGNVAFPGTLPDSGIAFGDVLPGDYTITYTPPDGYLLADGEVATKTAQVTYAQAIEVNFNVVAAPAPTGTLTITVTGFGAGAAGGSAEVLRTDIGGQAAQTVGLPVNGSIGLSVVAGTYSVTYTPPTGFSMAGGAAGTLTGVAVTAGGTSSASFAVQADPTNGTLVVSVTGLTGSPANGGSAVAQRTDSAGSPITIAVSAAGNGSNANVPAGTYSVTYSPPSGFSVAGGATGTATGVAVTAGGTSTVPFVVQVNPTNGTLVVNVTGLTGFPATGGSAVAQRTDAAGAPITIAVSAGTGSGSNASVPAGTYTITYSPPSGFSVAGGVTNPVTGLVVSAGAAATVSFGVQADPTTGTLVVSVGGLTGSPANGGSAVAQRTDAAGSPITIAVSAAGSGSNANVPAGTYTVTYTAPSGFSATGTNPVTGKVVSAGATATVSFAVVRTTGTLQVNVTGLTGSPANGGSAVAQRTDAAGTPITIAISAAGSGSNTSVPVGTYSVTYTPPSGFRMAAGGATSTVTGVAVTAGGTSTVAFAVQAVGTLQVTVTGLTGSPANGGSAVAQRSDSAGSPITISVSAAGSGSSANVPAGTYTITYTPPSGFGVTSTNPVYGKVVSAGATATATFITAAAAVSTSRSTVSVSAGTVASGGTATLTLQAKDASGTDLTSGGLTVVFTASGGTSTGTIGATTDNGNGTYTAVFTAVTAGTATTVRATIGGVAVTSTLPTITVTVGAVSTSRSTVSVSAGTVAPGGTVTLTLQAKDAAGNNLTTGGLTVVFTVSGGTSTGTIGATTDNANGTYRATFTAGTAGTATTVRATIGGVAVTSTLPTLTVILAGGAPDLVEDFSTYASTAAMLSDPRGIYLAGENNNAARITLDTTDGPTALRRSMKYQFLNGDPADMTITRVLNLSTSHQDVWIELAVKFSSTFTTVGGGTNNPDMKFLFGSQWPSGARWQVKNGTYGYVWSPNHSGGNNDTYVAWNAAHGGMWWDDTWHVMRLHWKCSTTSTSADGVFDWWFDGYPSDVNYPDGFNTTDRTMNVLVLGANHNTSLLADMYYKWGYIKVWYSNPGW